MTHDVLVRQLRAAWAERGPFGLAHPADEEAVIEHAIAERDERRMRELLDFLAGNGIEPRTRLEVVR